MPLSEIPEVFRDHFQECLEHFGKRFNKLLPAGARGRGEIIQLMADFCGVSQPTARGWIDVQDEHSPEGETRIKAACYLDFHGYKIIEFERLPKSHRFFAELIGYGVITVPEALEILGFLKSSNLYQVIWCKVNTSPEKSEAMFQAWKTRREQLDAKKRQAFEMYRIKVLMPENGTRSVFSSEEVPVQVSVNVPNDVPGSLAVSASVAMMYALLFFFDNDGPIKTLSKEQLARMYILGGDIVPNLTNHLTELTEKLKGIQNAKG